MHPTPFAIVTNVICVALGICVSMIVRSLLGESQDYHVTVARLRRAIKGRPSRQVRRSMARYITRAVYVKIWE